MTHLDTDGTPARWEVIPDRQAIARSDTHDGTVRGATRPERNMLRTVKGDFDTIDTTALRTLNRVLQEA